MEISNGEIWMAKPALDKLAELKIPVRVSLEIARLGIKLNDLFNPVEKVRIKLVQQYGEKDGKGNISTLNASEENKILFNKAFDELMTEKVELEFKNKIKLPEKVSAACDKCSHNMDKPLEIEASLLMNLERFVEVV